MSEASQLHSRKRDESAKAPSDPPAKTNQKSESWDRVIISTGIIANIITVVGIVAINKHIQTHNKFPFMVSLSAMHFIFTAISLRFLLGFGVFQYKHAALKYVISKAALDCSSVAFMNINLLHNSVGTYQLSKLCCIPVTVAVQYIVWGTKISLNTCLALIALCVGIGIATVTDVRVTLVGTLWAMLAILATVLSQLLTNLYLNNLGCDALQLLYHTSPWISLGMVLLAPLLEQVTGAAGLGGYEATPAAVVNIALSCVLALGVNVTNYLVLGKTSALTYQVVGHLKTVLTLLIAYLLFDTQLVPKNLVGVSLALIAMMAYMHVRSLEAASAAAAAAASPPAAPAGQGQAAAAAAAAAVAAAEATTKAAAAARSVKAAKDGRPAVAAVYIVMAGAAAIWPLLPDVVYV